MLLLKRGFVSPLRDAVAAAELFAPLVAGLAVERLCAAYLDADLRLIRVTICPPGSSGAVALPTRHIVREALEADAYAVILAHNHPGGDPWPSDADCRVTRRFAALAGMLGLRLLDHLVFAGTRVESFRALSLL